MSATSPGRGCCGSPGKLVGWLVRGSSVMESVLLFGSLKERSSDR
jgi:hypothetical protein